MSCAQIYVSAAVHYDFSVIDRQSFWWLWPFDASDPPFSGPAAGPRHLYKHAVNYTTIGSPLAHVASRFCQRQRQLHTLIAQHYSTFIKQNDHSSKHARFEVPGGPLAIIPSSLPTASPLFGCNPAILFIFSVGRNSRVSAGHPLLFV